MKSASRYVDLIREVKIAGILDKHGLKLLRNIRTDNDIKFYKNDEFCIVIDAEMVK